jgi:quercetin dioxygenase-like cupin family protein
MSNFYDKWLNYWQEEKEERRNARIHIDEQELEWVRTSQDWRAALLCAPEMGFVTSGVSMISELPPRWHTGKHSHGEEVIYIVKGQGFSLVDGLRYDWEKGSGLFMPFGSVHQHFNTGTEVVRYFSAMSLPLERFVGLAKIIQYEEAGEISRDAQAGIDGIKRASSPVHPDYGRIVLRLEDALIATAKDSGTVKGKRDDEFSRSLPKEMRTSGVVGHHARNIYYMLAPENNFKTREVMISSVLCDEPGKNSGRHSHMEALLYVLQGEGYTVIDGEKIPWKEGSLFQVQGPETVHQHFNTGKCESQLMRIHYGIRSAFFQPIAGRVFPYNYYEFSSYTID